MAWVDGYTNTDFIDFASDDPFSEPYPAALWRCDPAYYGGYPFNALFPDMPDFYVKITEQRPYICVYDIGTPKAGFDNNGLAILIPSACETTEDLNGMWSATLVHPIDPEGRWQNILQNNILKINGQLFTIKSYSITHTGGEKYVSCYAEHIWYQQADGYIMPGYGYIVGRSGQYALLAIKNMTYYHADPQAHEVIYDFQGHSDIEWNDPDTPPTEIKLWVMDVGDGITPIDAMLGDSGLIAQKGGELYRDNFYYSINARRENAADDAFDCRIGKDMTGITRTVDTTNFASYFRIYDDWGSHWACAWVMSEAMQRQFPHHTVRTIRAPKPSNANDPDFDYDAYFNGVVIGQGEAWFKSHCKPIIGWEIDLIDVQENSDFMLRADRYVPGDRGRIFDPLVDSAPVEVMITSVTRDELRGITKKIVIGEQTGFTRPASPPVLLGVSVDSIGGEAWVSDGAGAFCLDKYGNKIVVEV